MGLLVGLRPTPATYVLVPDRAPGAIPLLGLYRDPETTKAASGCPGRPFARVLRVKIRLGKALRILEPAIDALHVTEVKRA
jgi:hypothetical protein